METDKKVEMKSQTICDKELNEVEIDIYNKLKEAENEMAVSDKLYTYNEVIDSINKLLET